MKTTVRTTLLSGIALGTILLVSACGNGDTPAGDATETTDGATSAVSETAACEAFFDTSERPDGYDSLRDRVETELATAATPDQNADANTAMRSTAFQLQAAIDVAPDDVADLLTEIKVPFDQAQEIFDGAEGVEFDTQAALDAIEPLVAACDFHGYEG